MERLRSEARESIECERREARSARDELSATVHALRSYYEGQRQGAERARALASGGGGEGSGALAGASPGSLRRAEGLLQAAGGEGLGLGGGGAAGRASKLAADPSGGVTVANQRPTLLRGTVKSATGR